MLKQFDASWIEPIIVAPFISKIISSVNKGFSFVKLLELNLENLSILFKDIASTFLNAFNDNDWNSIYWALFKETKYLFPKGLSLKKPERGSTAFSKLLVDWLYPKVKKSPGDWNNVLSIRFSSTSNVKFP